MMELGNVFTGDIMIECKKRALQEAKKYRTGLVLWTDGSKLDHGNAGAAVCLRDRRLNHWKDKSVFLGKIERSLMQNFGDFRSLRFAKKDTKHQRYAYNDLL